MFIGYLRSSEKPSLSARLIAMASKNQGVDLVYLTPKWIDYKKNKVKGLMLIDGNWSSVTIPIPKFIDINPHFYSSKKYKKLINSLKRKTKLSIDSRHIILKDDLQQQLRNDKKFSKISIPTYQLTSYDDLVNSLKEFDTIVVKPTSGLKGNNVIKITKMNEGKFKIGKEKKEEYINDDELENLYDEISKDTQYIAQKYIDSKSKQGDPYDCRIHLEKNGLGKWEPARMFIRIGIGQKIVSNIAQGGAISNPKDFLANEFGDDGIDIYKKLEKLANELPYWLEKTTEKTLMTMGLDVGIDKDGNLYVFEVNSYPIYEPQRAEIALLRAQYYKYVLESERQAKYLNKINQLEKENRMYKKRLTQMETSTSWKVSKPIRFLGSLFKK